MFKWVNYFMKNPNIKLRNKLNKKSLIILIMYLLISNILYAQSYEISYKFIKEDNKTDNYEINISYPFISNYKDKNSEKTLNDSISVTNSKLV